MRSKQAWTLQSLLTCLLLNAVLVVLLFMMARETIQGMHQWVDPFLKPGASPLPDDVQSAFTNLNQFLNQAGRYLAPAVFGIGAAATFFLWLFVMVQGRGFAKRFQAEGPDPGVKAAAAAKESKKQAKKAQEVAPTPPQIVPPSPQPAIQLLSILQREGRLVDFLQEDLNLYEDAQIGAAVRSIHQGCKDALSQHIDLKPIFDEAEGADVTVPANFDARAIRLTGNVAGNPPFKGALRHRGWRAARVELPQPAAEQKKDWIVAPAEVEVEG